LGKPRKEQSRRIAPRIETRLSAAPIEFDAGEVHRSKMGVLQVGLAERHVGELELVEFRTC
jgi:hypothetical protein